MYLAMKPLIEITTVPIQIEMKTTRARLEYARGTAEMEVSRDEGGLRIQSKPIRINIDTYEARNWSRTPRRARRRPTTPRPPSPSRDS